MVIKHLLNSLNESIKKSLENVKEIVDEIPSEIKSYEDMLDYVKEAYTSLDEICPDILDILENTNFELSRTYYTCKIGNNTVYFDRAYTDDNIRIFEYGKRNIILEFVYVNIRKPGNIIRDYYTIYTDQNTHILNDELNNQDDIYIKRRDITIPFNDIVNACTNILAKLLYIALGQFSDPVNNKGNKKEYVKEFGQLDLDKNGFDKTGQLLNLINKVEKKVKRNYEKMLNEMVKILKYNGGNCTYEELKTISPEAYEVTKVQRENYKRNSSKKYIDCVFEHIDENKKIIYYKPNIYTCTIEASSFVKFTVYIHGCYLMWSDNCHDFRIGVYYNFEDGDMHTKENLFLTKLVYNWFNDNSIRACISETDHYKLGILLIANMLYDSNNINY